jgi:hypothetical protein
MMVAFSVDDPVVREVFASEVVPYGLLSTNHSGSRSAVLMETPVRVVCANTLASAMGAVAGNRVNVLHRGEPGVKVVEAAERMFVRLTDRYRDIAVRFKVMKEARLDAQAFQRSVLDLMAPLPKTRPGQSETRYEQMHEKAMLRRAKLFDLWHHGDGHKGDESAWEAFNAAVQAIDHDDEMFRTRGPRVESLMVGGLGKLKARVERAVMQEARAAGW